MPRHEMDRLQLSPKHLMALQILLTHHVPGSQVWAYGSRVTRQAHEGSDLDIVVRNPADLAAETPGCPALQDAVRESDLPMLVDVHDWARLPESFHRNIEGAYVEIQTFSPHHPPSRPGPGERAVTARGGHPAGVRR